jgi:small subunit ribosomal protein S2
MAVISMKQFLAAGVHFGHQTKRWHPNMAPYIYGIKNGVHVIDLRQTLTKLKEAYEYVKASAEEGRVPLFVGTKIQIQRIVKEEADRCGCPYINFRWLGGLLTNFGTVKQSIARMKTFEEVAGEDGSYEGVIKKEALMMERKRVKLERSLGGVRNMKSVPSMLFITDCHKEQLALKEAQKLGIPVVGIADTNCDPTGIDFVIPGNDDSPRAVALYANVIATAVMEGLAARKQTRIESITEEKAAAKKAKPAAKAKEKETDVVSEAKAEEEKKPEAKAKEKKAEETPAKIKEEKTEAAPGPKSAETKVAAEKAKPEVKEKPEVKTKSEAKAKEKKAEVVTEAKSAVEKTPAKKTTATAKKAETASGEKVPAAKATKAKKLETKK